MRTIISLLFLLTVLSSPIYAQQPINYGEMFTASISIDGEVDTYTFTGIENEKVIIRLTEYSGSYPLEPSLELFDPTGSVLTSVSDGAQAEIKIILPRSGTYTIFASDVDGNDTGSYALFVQRMVDPGNTTVIGYGETLTAGFASDGEVDTYSFTGYEGDQIIVRLTEYSGSYPLEPYVELFDPLGDSLTVYSDAAQAQIKFTLTAEGNYTLLVSDVYPGDDTGSYSLFIQRLVDPGNSTVIEYGETLTAGFASDGEVDTYSFSGYEGDQIIVRLTEYSGSYPLEPLIELFDPNGDSLAVNSDVAQAHIEFTLTKEGSYTLFASDVYPGDDTGSYSLFIQRLVNPGHRIKINFSETLASNFSSDGDVDTFVFLGGVEDSVIIRLTENSNSYPLEPFVELFSPSGEFLISASNATQAEIGIRLHEAGYYTILTSDSYPGDDTGNYTIFLFGFMASQIVAVPQEVDFGEVIVDQTGEENFLLYNRATFDVSLNMAMEGDDPDNFDVVDFSSLDAGDSQYVSLSFTPDAVDSFNAVLLVTSDGGETSVNLNGTGIPDPTAINDKTNAIPTDYQLQQNYPNPFNPATVISYQLPVTSDVRLTIYNMLGEVVATPLSENQPAGIHSIQFDGSQLSSGVYFYNLQAGEFNQVRKMLLVK